MHLIKRVRFKFRFIYVVGICGQEFYFNILIVTNEGTSSLLIGPYFQSYDCGNYNSVLNNSLACGVSDSIDIESEPPQARS